MFVFLLGWEDGERGEIVAYIGYVESDDQFAALLPVSLKKKRYCKFMKIK